MRRRITEAIVGVSALILVVLGIPLALAVHSSILDSEVVELQASAARALAEIAVPLDLHQIEHIGAEPDAPPPFSVYDASGAVIFGIGPSSADPAIRQALAGNPTSTTHDEIVVVTPITDHATERVVGVLRITEPLTGVDHRSRVAWLIMAVAGALALIIGWLIATRVARRLAQPVTDLAAVASRIGDGSVALAPAAPSGIAEIDTLSTALADSSARVNAALARERQFSADVSHQLRTPLTALRLRLESVAAEQPRDLVTRALDDLERVEQTVQHLLDYARDNIPAGTTSRLDEAVRRAGARWREQVGRNGRTIVVAAGEPLQARGSPASIDQILDVLIDNALRHGTGEIRIGARRLAGGGAIDVSDGGTGQIDPDLVFRRGHGADLGIGLALARSIAEAEGGRLILARQDPTTFSLILLGDDAE
ncbi:MAG: integral rane sensor signal transduction histidine kinase [Acidimicrobiales bacterium]|nr:integral rane sensor signal transduction histidine kinase [Acidimicrobiales bacterium]